MCFKGKVVKGFWYKISFKNFEKSLKIKAKDKIFKVQNF